MIDRPLSQREELKLGASGKGDGRFFAAAKVRMKGDTLEAESYSPQPLRLLGVKPR